MKPIALPLLLFSLALASCRSKGFEPPPAWELGGQTAGYHEGPMVAAGDGGPRYAMAGLLDGWRRVQSMGESLDVLSLPRGWQLLPGDKRRQIRLWPGEKGAQARTLVLHVDSDSHVWTVVCEFMQAWTEAQETLQIVPPDNHLVVALGPAEDVLSSLVAGGYTPFAWVTVEPGQAFEVTLMRGPDPLSPLGGPLQASEIAELAEAAAVEANPMEGNSTGSNPSGADPEGGQAKIAQASYLPREGPANGLALVLRMGLVDAGLVSRPWKSRERPFDGWAFGQMLANAGIAQARVVLGNSGLDLLESDQPNLGEDQRAMLAVFGSLQALAAPSASDLDRYLSSLKLEMRLRQNQEDQATGMRWMAWLRDARLWTRSFVLGI